MSAEPIATTREELEVCTTPEVRSETAEGIKRIVIDRPESMNAATPRLLNEIENEMRLADSDPDVGVVVLTGAGKAFCAGADLSLQEELSGPGAESMMDLTNSAIQSIVDCSKPVIAAVNGPAVGAGVSLALAADFTIARRSAYFLLAFIKVGLMPDGGSTALVAASVGRAQALRAALLGERISATDAYRMGLIAEVAADDDFYDRVTEIATAIAGRAGMAYRHTKNAINFATLDQLDSAFARERSGQAELLRSPEFARAAKAFLGK